MHPKVLVLGANGMLGHMLCRKLPDHFKITACVRQKNNAFSKKVPHNVNIREGFNLFDISLLESIIQDEQPDWIINCIGVIKQSKDVSDIPQMYHINGFFPHQLAKVALKFNAKVLHFSTDCVFNGKADGIYTINSIPTAEDDYGKSKLLGELNYEHCLTLRTSIVGRELSRHSSLFDWFISQKGTTVKGFANALYTGLTTLEVARAVQHIIEMSTQLSGCYQLASQSISKYDLLQKINKSLNLNTTIIKDTEFRCNRRLCGETFEKKSGFKVNNWDTMIQEFTNDNINY